MSEELHDLATIKQPITGYISKNLIIGFRWLPHYISSFKDATRDIQLEWKKCNFVKGSEMQVPDKHGVYCFSISLNHPFPNEIIIPLYIGKAAPGYLCERFADYLYERNSTKGRSKILWMLNSYRNKLIFWWAELPRIQVDTVEEHLLMCCTPPCNEIFPSREKLWAKAFD